MSKEEKNSFVTPEDLKKSEDFKEDFENQERKEKAQKTMQKKVMGTQTPFLLKLDKIIELLEKNLEVKNALLTALIEPKIGKTTTTNFEFTKDSSLTSEQNKEVVFPQQVEKSFETKVDNSRLEEIKMMFPEDLENMLSFSQEDDRIVIRCRQFLGADNFAKIASVIRAINGEYVSAGKESHFRVPLGSQSKKKQQSPSEQTRIDGDVPLPQPAPNSRPKEQVGDIELAKGSFPDELAKLLTFEDKGDHIKVKAISWLGTDKFAKVARIVREMKGEYISSGKDTHFKLYKKQE